MERVILLLAVFLVVAGGMVSGYDGHIKPAKLPSDYSDKTVEKTEEIAFVKSGFEKLILPGLVIAGVFLLGVAFVIFKRVKH